MLRQAENQEFRTLLELVGVSILFTNTGTLAWEMSAELRGNANTGELVSLPKPSILAFLRNKWPGPDLPD